MTHDELKNAPVSPAVARLNPHLFAGVCAAVQEPDQGCPLVSDAPRAPASMEGARFRLSFDVWAVRPQDWVNLSDGAKRLEDGLVAFGLLPDDNWKIIPQGTIRTHKAASKAQERTEITIETINS